MSSEIPSKLDSENLSSPSKPYNRLALTSFYLSLVSLALFAVWFVLPSLMPAYFPLQAVLFFGGLGTGIAGVVTSILALVQGNRYPPQQARTGFAIAGLVIGILDICGLLGFFVIYAMSALLD